MHLDRRVLYFTAFTLTALTFTLTVIMVISTYRNMHLERMQQEELLSREGDVLLHLFDTIVEDCSSNPIKGLPEMQRLITSVPNADIAYIYLLDENGVALAHSNQQSIGQRIDGDLPDLDESLTLSHDDGSERIFEVRRHFQSATSKIASDYFLGIGLRMADMEQVYHEDRRHRIMMAAILVLLGTATVFFILVVQNSYLVQRTLDRMTSYTQYVVESMANGLISLDANGVVTTINPAAAELTGIPKAKARGLSFDSLLSEYADEIRSVLWDDNTILNREIEYERPDGSRIPMSLSATQVKDSSGARLGAVVLLNDLREIRELNERARRVEHLASIGRMAATVAHEIRNPLSAIRGLAQYFATNAQDSDPEERSYAETIVSESDRLNTVVSELLDYARPLELHLEETHIEALFDDTIRAIVLETEEKGIEIEQNIEPDIPAIQLDRDRLLQILLNLTQNSIAAMPDGGKLVLRAEWLTKSQSIQLTIEDTGAGISEQDIPRLFEPFFTTRTHGTGLGLAIVHKIIDAYNGKIEVHSKEGKGTKVILTITPGARMSKVTKL